MTSPRPGAKGIGGPDAPVVVVAGTTGSGKSTVCNWLAERGAYVIDADRIGHEMLRATGIRARLVEIFGEQILGDDGEICRRTLGEMVFADGARLAELVAIVHPPLVAELRRRIEVLRSSRGAQLIVVDAALWTEFPDPPPIDLLLHVVAPRAARRERIVARDRVPVAQADARIARQADLEASLAGADAVLENASRPDAVRTRLLEILDERLGLRLVDTDPGARPHNVPE